MARRTLSFISLVLALGCLGVLAGVGCEGSDTFGTPLYIKPGEDPFATPPHYIASIYVDPPSANLAVGAIQKFKATAIYNTGESQVITESAEWFTETPGIGVFEPTGGKFLAQKPGIGVVRCRISQGGGWLVSMAAFVNVFNPNGELPPAIPQNPKLEGTPEGVKIWWDLNRTDIDVAGYNVYRTQVSGSHYASDYTKVNPTLILYPPYLDKTVVSGWYFYRVTAEDLLGVQSAPSEEVSIFVTAQSHYAGGYDGNVSGVQESRYKELFTGAL